MVSTDHMTTSSSSSVIVKHMLEDAMSESLKEVDAHSTGSDKSGSDLVRVESGLNSGQTSGDEIDTTTSSDIEIISNPTPNGENGGRVERPFDLSPLRHALRTVRRSSPPGHKRSDSGSSGQSSWSKSGDDLVSPESGRPRSAESLDGVREDSKHHHAGRNINLFSFISLHLNCLNFILSIFGQLNIHVAYHKSVDFEKLHLSKAFLLLLQVRA